MAPTSATAIREAPALEPLSKPTYPFAAGLVVSTPNEFVPEKNSTCVTLPSLSEALALTVMSLPVLNIAPLAGLVILTVRSSVAAGFFKNRLAAAREADIVNFNVGYRAGSPRSSNNWLTCDKSTSPEMLVIGISITCQAPSRTKP